MPTLNWIGKEAVVKHHKEVPFRLLVEAGGDLHVKDRVYAGTPLDWAEYLKQDAIAAYLRGQ